MFSRILLTEMEFSVLSQVQNTLLMGCSVLGCVCFTGCESLYEAGVPGMENFIDFSARAGEEEQYRSQFLSEGDPQALRWLMANRLDAGMPISQVRHILGDQGQRVLDDREIKTNGGHYRSGDVVHKWGPDREGRSIYLVFRDGILVNYNPEEYQQDWAARF